MKTTRPTDKENKQINAGIKVDPDNPEWSDEMFRRAVRGPQKAPTKKQLTVRLDPDVVEWFRSQGPGYQSRMNEALRRHMAEHSGLVGRAG